MTFLHVVRCWRILFLGVFAVEEIQSTQPGWKDYLFNYTQPIYGNHGDQTKLRLTNYIGKLKLKSVHSRTADTDMDCINLELLHGPQRWQEGSEQSCSKRQLDRGGSIAEICCTTRECAGVAGTQEAPGYGNTTEIWVQAAAGLQLEKPCGVKLCMEKQKVSFKTCIKWSTGFCGFCCSAAYLSRKAGSINLTTKYQVPLETFTKPLFVQAIFNTMLSESCSY